jgi:nucleotide-binding universal stress UspA family protein
MRILVGVDWSDEAFAALEQIGILYRLDDVVLVHAVVQAANLQGHVEFRQAVVDAVRPVVERCRALLPAETSSIRTLCEAQEPVSFILHSAATVEPDLIVIGTGDPSLELFEVKQSQRILLHATVPTLIVKGKVRSVTRVLMAVEGREDAIRVQTWLTAHPFKNPVAITILSVLPQLDNISEELMASRKDRIEQTKRDAEQLVNDTGRALASPHFAVATDVGLGDPVTTVCEVGHAYDLIVVSTHGRTGLNRFVLGSVSDGIVHRADCSVLVVR